MRAALTHPASKLSKTSLRLDAVVRYVLVIKRMQFKTNLLFWIFLVVVYGFTYFHKDKNVNKFRIPLPTTKYFIKGGKCETLKGVNVVVLMVNAGKWGVKIKWRLLPNFMFPGLSSHLSVFSKLRIVNPLLHFLLLC